MTTNTNAALRTIADWPITDTANMDAVNMAHVARAALASAPKAEPVPAGEYPPLPEPWIRDLSAEFTDDQEHFHADQMRAYVDADRAMRAQAAPQPAVQQGDAVATIVCRSVAELPDRDSPEGWAEAMLVTHEELHSIVFEAVNAAQAAPQPAPIFGDEDHVLVPQMLLSAACSAIDKKREGSKVLFELRRYTTGDLSKAAHQPAVQQGDGGTDIGQLGRRTVLDAIRSAYDIGYSDARNARTYPGDSAPGYKGRDVEKDHGGALIAKLNALAARPHTAAPAAQGDALDSDRLNWLEANAQITIERLRRIGSEKRVYEVASNDDEIYGEGDTLREAIDAARAAKEGA